MSATARPVLLEAVSAGGRRRRPDVVAVEAPLEIRVAGPGEEPQALAVVLRTPGDDLHLALGFALSEGVVSDRDEVLSASHCSGPGGIQPNVVVLRLRRPAGPLGPARLVHTGCGLCGRSKLPASGDLVSLGEDRPAGRPSVGGALGGPAPTASEAPVEHAAPDDRRALEYHESDTPSTLASPATDGADIPARMPKPLPAGSAGPDRDLVATPPEPATPWGSAPGEPTLSDRANWQVPVAVVLGAPESLRRRQRVFAATGGSHGAALLEADGRVVRTAEDVGRHNALDKLIGWSAALGRWPLATFVLALSGRVGYELVHKATIAGIPVIVGVSAPSSGAIELAAAAGVTLVGFTRATRANIYTHPERVI